MILSGPGKTKFFFNKVSISKENGGIYILKLSQLFENYLDNTSLSSTGVSTLPGPTPPRKGLPVQLYKHAHLHFHRTQIHLVVPLVDCFHSLSVLKWGTPSETVHSGQRAAVGPEC